MLTALRRLDPMRLWRLLVVLTLSACGGGAGVSLGGPGVDAAALAIGNEVRHAVVLQAVPPPDAGGGGGGGNEATSLTVHYRRLNGDYAGWQIHTWNAARDPGWNQGHAAAGSDAFGAVFEVPLVAHSGTVGYLFHKGDTKDHGNADQAYTLQPGRNEIWRIEGDGATYRSNPLGTLPPDLHTVRVRYKRFDGQYADWGLHLWAAGGVDAARLPGLTIDRWAEAVPLAAMPGYRVDGGDVVFDIPVLNPREDASRKALAFVIHGLAPRQDDKDGRPDDIRVDYGSLAVLSGVAGIQLVQGDATVYSSTPDLRQVSTTEARAVWLNGRVLQWPRIDASLPVRLYHSAAAALVVAKDRPVTGHDAVLELDATADVPAAAAERFKYVEAGGRFAVRAADLPRLKSLHRGQLVLVQQDAQGRVQNATTLQLAGALDELYAAAGRDDAAPLGVQVAGGRTSFALWAPTARRVTVFTYAGPQAPASTATELTFDEADGRWTATLGEDLSGRYYRYAVEVFVRGVGMVRNLVTDPYSVSLSADSRRSFIADLEAPATQPDGWREQAIPSRVASAADMSIYELHVRDFSAGDASVPAALRGKYAAFAEAGSAGMQHLKALADAGLTDVHLLPVFDIASVAERGCTTPSPAGAPDAQSQQAAVAAGAGSDCYNWGYDPWHFNAPEGSYASQADDGLARIVEFRRMVMGLHRAGLRVGMDVVYNHTSASGQNERSVLDRIVPGYYHRLDARGGIERSTCCENTATENMMMARLMIDSTLLWARHYRVSSFRFDIMGHQPRSVMEQLEARLAAALGRQVQLLGEGWNFGEVADGARFVQASQWSLNGSGIGTFSHFARDAVRGGSPFDAGEALVARQGWINGLHYDPNALATATRDELLRAADIVRAGLAGSIRSFEMEDRTGQRIRLEQLRVDGQGAGYVTEPSEVVNYVENHDNQTLFDNNAFKLPRGTSREDRARVQLLGAAVVAFSQGVAYFHAGVDTLRSKSLDRNSYDSGDWFNRLDWTYGDNFFGIGLPPAGENGANWAQMQPLLADPAIKPTPADIAWTRDAFRDLLRLRASTTLLRLPNAAEIRARLSFPASGASQPPTVVVGHVDGQGLAGAGFKALLYAINVDKTAQVLELPSLKDRGFVLHPVHRAAGAADRRIAGQARWDAAAGQLTVPARSAVAWVIE